MKIKRALVPLIVCASLALSACAPKNGPTLADILAEAESEAKNEESSTSGDEADAEEIAVEGAKGLSEGTVNLSTITKEELYNLDLDVMMASLEEQAPNYRDFFMISEDTDVTDENVKLQIKDLLFYALFGITIERWLDEIAGTESSVTVTVVEEEELALPGEFEFTTDSMLSLTKEYLESLTPDEIAKWYDGYCTWLFGEPEYVEGIKQTDPETREYILDPETGEVVIEPFSAPMTLGTYLIRYATDEEKEEFKELLIESLEEGGLI